MRPLGTPLIDREAGDAAVAAWLDHIAADPALPKLLLMPYLAEGALRRKRSPRRWRDRNGRSAHFDYHHARAARAADDDAPAISTVAMPHKKAQGAAPAAKAARR